jgi:hypothetical protein
MDPELRSLLGRHRDELLRRALALAVTRGTLEDLVRRPLHERLEDLELLFEAAAGGGRVSAGAREPLGLQAELAHQLDEHRREERPFSVAVVAAGVAHIGRITPESEAGRTPGPDAAAWRRALEDCAAPGDVVIDAGDGATVVVLPDHEGREAAIASDRLRRAAWRLLGEQGPLAGMGVASFPADGVSPYEILAAAYDALWRRADFGVVEPLPSLDQDGDRAPAPVQPLRGL